MKISNLLWLSLLFLNGSLMLCSSKEYSEGIRFKRELSHISQVPLYKLPSNGNELQIFEYYANLTSAMNDETTWKLWTDCLNLVSQNFKNGGCVKSAHDIMAKRMSITYGMPGSLHDDRVRPGAGKADCSYSLHTLENKYNAKKTAGDSFMLKENSTIVTASSDSFSFRIRTVSCKSDSVLASSTFPTGGASFDIQVWSETHAAACVVIDHLSGLYDVQCPLHDHSRVVRYNMLVTLDFEHFDAYSDTLASAPLLDVIVFEGEVSVLHKPLQKMHTARKQLGRRLSNDAADPTLLARKNVNSAADNDQTWILTELDRLSRRTWGEWVRHGASDSAAIEPNTPGLLPRNNSIPNRERSHTGAMSDFHWHGSGSLFTPDSRDMFERVFGKDADEKYEHVSTILLGESHMRFTWDLFFYLFSGGAEALGHLERKHGSTNHISRLALQNMYFVTDMADFILARNCPPAGTTHIYVVQFGSWDLTYSTLRNTMVNKFHLPHFLAAVRLFTKKCGGLHAHEHTDRGRVHFIWATPSPEPRCLARRGQQQKLCAEKRHANNNHAISALAQRTHLGLLEAIATQFDRASTAEAAGTSDGTSRHRNQIHDLQDTLVTYERIDTFWIASPRFRLWEGVCMSHLLCHPSGDIMQLTAAGLAVAGEVLSSVSNRALSHALNYQNIVAHTHAGEHINADVIQLSGKGPPELENDVDFISDSVPPNKSILRHSNLVVPSILFIEANGGIEKKTQYFFRSINGLRRLIPDSETLQCLQHGSPSLPRVNMTAENIVDIPLIATSLPSRASGHMYTGENMQGEGQIWMITDKCTRKRIDPTAARSGVTTVFEMDIYDIPED